MSPATWELLSYVVTVIGLPMAIAVFLTEKRKERRNEEEAVYESVSDNYQEFLRIVLEHPDLHLFSMTKTPALTEDQQERMMVIFSMLISLFERAYMLLYEEGANSDKLRRWHSWEDYMREWCAREDFRDSLDTLLTGEDPDFCAYIRGLAKEA
jgi:succinate dehydrogenase flavin-adding protein (antitoxin of CptAB toxin-antitoxin module)